MQQAQKTDLQNYADKLKKGKVTYSDYAPISLEEQQKAIAEENNLNNDQTAIPANAANVWADFIYYYHPDHLGTSTALTDFNGQPNQFFLNLPFGETMAEQSGLTYNTPYKFNGKELDEETGFYYYGARYYDPRISIWMSTDPLAEKFPSHSPYNNCLNNPLNLIDPDGKSPTDWYKNLLTGKISWKDGQGLRFGYKDLGHSIGFTDVKGNRTLLNGDTKQISINGKVVDDFKKNSDGTRHGGFAFADGGNNQDPSSLDKGGRDVQWIDFKGMLEIFTLLLGTDRESPAAGKVTPDTKTKSAIDAVGNAFNHWKKHALEFPEFQNSLQYVKGAKYFMNNRIEGELTKIRPNGDFVKYHPQTNTFGITNSLGEVKTMFRPTEGISYWLNLK